MAHQFVSVTLLVTDWEAFEQDALLGFSKAGPQLAGWERRMNGGVVINSSLKNEACSSGWQANAYFHVRRKALAADAAFKVG
jgi:hypothetical protein